MSTGRAIDTLTAHRASVNDSRNIHTTRGHKHMIASAQLSSGIQDSSVTSVAGTHKGHVACMWFLHAAPFHVLPLTYPEIAGQ